MVEIKNGLRFLTGPTSVQGSSEWLEFRKGKLGGSDAPAIMNVGFKTPLQLFEEKMEDIPTEENEAMRRGKLMEEEARQHLCQKYGLDIQPAVVLHPNHEFDWHYSSVDGIAQRPDGSWIVCEIKCPGWKDHELAIGGRIPEKYVPQLNHILEDCKGVNQILYHSYHPSGSAYIWYQPDEYELSTQFGYELSFYTKMLNFTPPEPTDEDWVALNDQDLLQKTRQFRLLSAQIEEWEERRIILRQEIIQAMGTLKRAQVGNTKVQRIMRKGNIEYTDIPELKSVDLEPYRKKPIVSYRIS